MATSIAKIVLSHEQSASGVIAYMSDPQAIGDYYSEDDRAPMRWIASAKVRTAFAISDDLVGRGPELGLLLEGRHPVTGDVIRRWGPTGTLVSAHDVTISPAPKSVSVLWGLGDRPLQRELERMVWQAASQAILALSDEALVRERYGPGSSDIRNVVSSDIVGVDVLHTVARLSTEAEVPDPQLHVHTLLIGALDRAGQLRALDSLAIHRARAFVDGFASSHLAAAMQARGFEIAREVDHRGRVSWEVVGVPPDLTDAMSQRSRDLEELAKEYEEATEGHEAAGSGWDRYKAARRRSKRKHQAGAMRAVWEATAADHGFGPDQLAAMVATANRRRATWLRPDAESKAAEQFRRELLANVCREHALVPQRQVWKTAMQSAVGLLDPPTVAGVLGEMFRSGDLLVTEDSDRGLVTTPEILATERRAVDAAVRLLAEQPEAAADPDELERILQEAEAEGRPFDQHQEAAITLATSGRRLVSISGPAGTGKGYASSAMVRAFRAQGRRTIAIAVAGRTAQQARADSGSDEAYTLDSLIARVEHGGAFRLSRGDVILMDEAGMLDHQRYADLLTAAALNGATVIQIGDSRQLSPVEAGGLWTVTHQLAEADGAAAQLVTVRRARDPHEAQAWTDVRDGRVLEGLAYWDQQGRLRLYEDRTGMREGMVAEWWADGEGRGIMLVDTSNAERDAINRLAQEQRMQAGQLGVEALELPTGRALRVGDEVLFSAIHPAEERRVENGTTASVQAVDLEAATATLRLHEPAGERVVTVDTSAPVELGYARHVAKSQGMTAEGISNLGVGEMTDANRFYVMVSRGRDGAQIHAVTEDIANVAMPTLPAPTDEQREQLTASGLEEIPAGWSTVDASLELDARQERPLGSSALEQLGQTAISEAIAQRIVVKALRARQEHEEAPITHDQVAPELTVDLKAPDVTPEQPGTAEQQQGAQFLLTLDEHLKQREAEKVTVRQIAKRGQRDGTKVAVDDRPVAAGEYPAEQAVRRSDRWDERDTPVPLETVTTRLDDLTASAERQRRMERQEAERRASERLQEVREAAKERTVPPRQPARPERLPEPLPAARAVESVARAHVAGDVDRAEGYYRALGQVRYADDPQAEAARAWLGDREAAVIVPDVEQAEAVRSAIAESDPEASPRILIAQEAYAARAEERRRQAAESPKVEQALPVERAYVIADRQDRRQLTHALSATPEGHWITTRPTELDEKRIDVEARSVKAAIDARRAAEQGTRRNRSKERTHDAIEHDVVREAERPRTRTNTHEVA